MPTGSDRRKATLDAGAPTDFYTRKDSDDAIACAERLIGFARDQVELRSGG